jgi:hypothetical protein
MENLPDSLRTVASDVALLGVSTSDFRRLSNEELFAGQALISALRGYGDRYAAMVAGEVARRSAMELGDAGLARAGGYLSPQHLIQSMTSISRQEATRLIRVGAMIAEAEELALAAEREAAAAGSPGAGERDDAGGVDDAAIDPAGDGAGDKGRSGSDGSMPPTTLPHILVAVLEAGALSIDGLHSISRGLGDVDDAVTEAQLAEQGRLLIETSHGRTPEQLYNSARRARDLLDEGGIERREKERRDLRSVRTWWDASGMHCGSWRLPPEEGMIVATAFDAVLSPRRGGPRFVDKKPAPAPVSSDGTPRTVVPILVDVRTTEQVAADALVDLVRLAVDADPGVMFGRRRPAVRVVVTESDLHNRSGHGQLEGHNDPVSFPTIERHFCDTGAISIGFDDDGQCVNVGRNKRLFTEKQRIGMAVRDGGCIADGCDRPPSYCEAHHIDQWLRDDGRTDIADGVLLCRRHHLLLHNTGWQITREGGNYFVRPPASVDPNRALIRLRSRNPIMDTIRRAA